MRHLINIIIIQASLYPQCKAYCVGVVCAEFGSTSKV